jgi:hypothetical protein
MTSLTSSANPSVHGQAVTFTAPVAPVAPGGGTPTGTVSFKEGATLLGTRALSSGQAQFTTSSLGIGTHSITASYNGYYDFNGSTSAPLTQTVNPVGTLSTTATLASSVNPLVYGQSLTFTATVAAVSPGAGTPTGTVAFKEGASLLGTGTLDASARATFSTSALAVGTHSITAYYWGDPIFGPCTSAPLTQTVNPVSTTTTLTASPNPSVYGQSVTFAATVTASSPGSGTPTVTVTFKDGATTLGTGTLSSGHTQFTISTLSVGNHSITAVYNGDPNFSISTSTALTQVVNKASTTTRLTSSVNPTVDGQPVTFTATVAAVSPGAGTPTGTVTFKDGATTLGTRALSSGQAQFTTSSLGVGNHSITAVYDGDSNYRASTSAKLTQKVNRARTATRLTSSANPSVYEQAVTSTPTVAAASPGAMTTTGTATLRDGATITGRRHVRLQRPSGFHSPVAAIRQLLDHRRLQRRTPPDKVSTSAKLTQTGNA